MLLKIMWCQDPNGGFAAITRYEGHTKNWHNDSLTSIKKSAGSFLGTAHKNGVLTGVNGLKFVEGLPNDNTVWLLDEQRPDAKRRKRRVVKQPRVVNLAEQKPAPDDVEYFYKEEDGVLKIYRKALCHTFRLSAFN